MPTNPTGPAVFLPIKPRFAEAIMAGTKRWEFRKRPMIANPETGLIYATGKVGLVLGTFKLGHWLSGDAVSLHLRTGFGAGISLAALEEYLRGRRYGFAFHVFDVHAFPHPIPRAELPFKIPQSFRYLTDAELQELVERGNRDA